MLAAYQNVLTYYHILYSHIIVVVSLFLRQIFLFWFLLCSFHEMILQLEVLEFTAWGKRLAASPAPLYGGTRSNIGQYQPTVQCALCLVQLQGCSWNNVALLIHGSSLRISTKFQLYWITFSVICHCVHSTVSGSGPVYFLYGPV